MDSGLSTPGRSGGSPIILPALAGESRRITKAGPPASESDDRFGYAEGQEYIVTTGGAGVPLFLSSA
jgi:hypothetical protein